MAEFQYDPYAPVPEERVGTAADFGKTLGAGFTDIGSNVAAMGRYAAEAEGRPDVAELAKQIGGLFGDTSEAIRGTMNPETLKLAQSAMTSDEFWERPVLATALKATGMLPSVVAVAVPGGLLADVTAATMAAAAGGAALNTAQPIDEFYKKLDAMSDADLQEQSPKYRALREVFDEEPARARFNREAQGWAPAINLILGAGTAALGPAGVAARRLAGGTGNVIGAAERGAVGAGVVGAAEGVATNALQEGASDVGSQQAEIYADFQKDMDYARAANAAIEGGALGGLMGGVAGAVLHGGSKGAKKAGGVVEDADGVSDTRPAVTSDVPGPQPDTSRATATPAKPVATADIGNEQSAPSGSERVYDKNQPKGGKKADVAAVAPAAPDAAQAAAIKAMNPEQETHDVSAALDRLTQPQQAVTPEVTPPAAPSPEAPPQVAQALQNLEQGQAVDTGQNVPESPQTLELQIAQIGQGGRKAVMFPTGTAVPAKLPAGLKRAKNARGTFVFDPRLTNVKEINALSKAGRENELLGMGPVSKNEAIGRVMQGEQPAVVTERTPDGTEVKAAVGTEQTAPIQVQALEQAKTPGNVIAVEQPDAALARRNAGGGRILPNLAQTAETIPVKPLSKADEAKNQKAVDERKAKIDEKVAAGMDPELAADTVDHEAAAAEEAGGKNYTKDDRAKLEARLAKQKSIADKHGVGDNEQHYLRVPGHRDRVIARARAMVKEANDNGITIQKQLKKSERGDAASDDPSTMMLTVANALVKAAEGKAQGAKLTEAVDRFKRQEALIRAGLFDDLFEERRVEGDAAMNRRTANENMGGKQIAAYDEGAEKRDTLDVTPEVAPAEGLGDNSAPDIATAVSKGPVKTEVPTEERPVKFKGGVEKKEEVAKAASAGKVLSDEEKAAHAARLGLTVKKGAPERAPTKAKQEFAGGVLEPVEKPKDDAADWLAKNDPDIQRELNEREAIRPARPEPGKIVRREEPGNVKIYDTHDWKLVSPGDWGTQWKLVNNQTRVFRMIDETFAREIMRAFNKSPEAAREVAFGPSEAQIAAGNYKKGHRRVEGLDFTIENPKGSIRRGPGWEVKMPADYGYIRRTVGADGDHIDAYDLRTGDRNFVVDQQDAKTGEFDEHKVFLRAKDEQHVITTYDKAFSDGKGPDRLGAVSEVSRAELHSWLGHADHTEPHLQHVVNEMDRALDTPEGPRGRPMNAVEAIDLINFNEQWGVAKALQPMIAERLKKLAGHVEVEIVTPEQMAQMYQGPNGEVPAGLHRRRVEGDQEKYGRSVVYINEDVLRKPGAGHESYGHVVLHELAHAVTVREIDNNPAFAKAIDELSRLANNFRNNPFNAFRLDVDFGNTLNYAFANAKEFVAEAFSNPEFQRFLSQVPLPPEHSKAFGLDRKGPMSVWDMMRHYVKKAIQKITGEIPQGDTVLDGILRLGDRITTVHEQQYLAPFRAQELRSRAEMLESVRKYLDDGGEAFIKQATDGVRRFVDDRALRDAGDTSPKLLKLRTFDNIAQLADHYFGEGNPIRKIHNALEKMRVTSEVNFAKAGPLIGRLAEARSKNAEGFNEFSSLLHDATIANVHPDVPLTDKKNVHLGKKRVVGKAVWAKAQHADLAARYRALTPELKELWHDTTKYFTDQQNAMSLGIIENRILKLLGVEDAALARRVHDGTLTDADRARLGDDMVDVLEQAGELSKIEGPYVPLIRRGDHVVKGTVKLATPAGATRLADNEFEFKTEKEATAYAGKSSLAATVKKVWVDEATGKTHETDPATGKETKVSAKDLHAVPVYRVEVDNRHVEFIDGRRAAERRAAELAKDGTMDVHKVVPRASEPGGRQATDLSASLQRLVAKLEKSEAYKQSTPTQQAALRAAVEEAAAASHGSTRIASKALPRRGVLGYSEDIVRNTGDYAESSSRYLAKLEHGTELEAGMKAMEDQLKSDHSKVGQYARTMIRNEIKDRVDGDNGFEQGGKFAPIVKRAMAISFIDKLASPAYSVINAMQPAMVAMPYLAGRHGVARTVAALSRAYNDIGAGGTVKEGFKETARRFKGSGAPEDYIANAKGLLKDPKERALIDWLVEHGVVDPNAGMEIRNIVKDYSGVGGKIDAGLGYLEGVTREMPRAIESINRLATALSAYRLERARGASHDAAIQYAHDTVNNTQFNYSATNAPKIFNHPLAKMAFQFKKYGQGMYQLIGGQIGKAMRNASPGDRAEAIKTLITLAGTHMAMAGALGLPTEPFKYLVMGTGFLTGAQWSDVEDKVRAAAADVFGKTGGEVFSRGLPRLLNLDLSRMGLDSVTSFGEPKSRKDADVKSWLFDTVAGPVVGLGADWVKGVSALAGGDVKQAAEKMIPIKVVSDSLRAYRQASEGKVSASGKQTSAPYGVQETVQRALGFGSGREAEEGAAKSAYFRQSARQKEERNGLVDRWVSAKPSEKMAAMAAITKWNQSQPAEVKIKPKELTDKLRKNERDAGKSTLGVTPSKRDRHLMEQAKGHYNVN